MNAAVVTIRTTDDEVFEVERDETVLAAAMRQGIPIPYSCRSGTCRTCFSRVISGSIEHEAEYADELMISPSEVEAGYRLLCSSIAYEDSLIAVGG